MHMIRATTAMTRLSMKWEFKKLRNISPIRPFSRDTALKATPSDGNCYCRWDGLTNLPHFFAKEGDWC